MSLRSIQYIKDVLKTPTLFFAKTNTGTCKMANLTVFVACTLVVLLFVDTSTAAVGDATCGDPETDKEECKNIVNAECDSTSGTAVCTCKTGTTEDTTTSTCPLGLDGDCSNLECTTEHAECNAAKKCACKSDYKPNGDNTACVQKSVNDYTCTDDDDSNCPENAVCEENECKCEEGYEENGNQCAGAAATKAMIWMMLSVLMIRLFDKLLM